jgi:hypothetical protein
VHFYNHSIKGTAVTENEVLVDRNKQNHCFSPVLWHSVNSVYYDGRKYCNNVYQQQNSIMEINQFRLIILHRYLTKITGDPGYGVYTSNWGKIPDLLYINLRIYDQYFLASKLVPYFLVAKDNFFEKTRRFNLPIAFRYLLIKKNLSCEVMWSGCLARHVYASSEDLNWLAGARYTLTSSQG